MRQRVVGKEAGRAGQGRAGHVWQFTCRRTVNRKQVHARVAEANVSWWSKGWTRARAKEETFMAIVLFVGGTFKRARKVAH